MACVIQVRPISSPVEKTIRQCNIASDTHTSTTLDIYAHHFDHRNAKVSQALDTILTDARKMAK